MTKYEEFKKWFKNHPTDENELDLVFAIGNLFYEFEEYYDKSHKKHKIMKIIWDTLRENSVQLSYEIDGIVCKKHPAEAIYDALDKEGLIK